MTDLKRSVRRQKPTSEVEFEELTRGDDEPVIVNKAVTKVGRPVGKSVEQVTVTIPKTLLDDFKQVQAAMIDNGIMISNESMWWQFAIDRLVNDYAANEDSKVEKDFRRFFRSTR